MCEHFNTYRIPFGNLYTWGENEHPEYFQSLAPYPFASLCTSGFSHPSSIDKSNHQTTGQTFPCWGPILPCVGPCRAIQCECHYFKDPIGPWKQSEAHLQQTMQKWSNDQVLLDSGHGKNPSFFYVFTTLQQRDSPQTSWADNVGTYTSTLKMLCSRSRSLYLGLFTLCMPCQAATKISQLHLRLSASLVLIDCSNFAILSVSSPQWSRKNIPRL